MILRNLLYGMIIGIGFIIPGVSGGVIATILGIYETVIDKLLNFFRDFKNNFKYLTPLFMGVFISVLFLSKVILYLLNYKLFFISYVFIGLILGCVPFLIKEIKLKSNKKISYIYFILSFTIGIILFIIESILPNIDNELNIFTMIIAGFLYAIGKIVPGISGASLLMLIGVYKYFLSIIANPLMLNLSLLIKFIPFIISFIISAIIILKLINYLLNNYFRETYSAIIGFVISSVLFIYPGSFNIGSIIISFLSFIISYNLSK